MPDSLIIKMIQTIYLGKELEHTRVTKTLKIFRKDYCFTRMTLLIYQFIKNCYNCK